jgi:hypothetical protein
MASLLSERSWTELFGQGMQGHAAFLQNAGLGRCGTQSIALGWYPVSRWDTGRK